MIRRQSPQKLPDELLLFVQKNKLSGFGFVCAYERGKISRLVMCSETFSQVLKRIKSWKKFIISVSDYDLGVKRIFYMREIKNVVHTQLRLVHRYQVFSPLSGTCYSGKRSISL